MQIRATGHVSASLPRTLGHFLAPAKAHQSLEQFRVQVSASSLAALATLTSAKDIGKSHHVQRLAVRELL